MAGRRKLSIYLSVCLSVCPSVDLSIYLCIYLSISLSLSLYPFSWDQNAYRFLSQNEKTPASAASLYCVHLLWQVSRCQIPDISLAALPRKRPMPHPVKRSTDRNLSIHATNVSNKKTRTLRSVTCMLHHATQPKQKASVVQQSPCLWPTKGIDHEMKRAAVKMQLQTRNMNMCVCPSAV